MNTTSQRCVAKEGYFDNKTTVCSRCPSECKSCASLINCTYCNQGLFLRIDNFCYLTCLARYFANSLNNSCTNCPFECLTCKNSSECLSCDSQSDFRVLNRTKCVPLSGYFHNKMRVSAKCPQTCALCLNLTFCTQCNVGYFLNPDNLCKSGCPPRYYSKA